MTTRLLIIGLDGATFDVLRPVMNAGYMPNLATLTEKGCAAVLRSTVPPVTPVAWTTFMTGKNPGKHGIFDFRLFDRETRSDTFANASHIRSATIWQILSAMGLSVGVLNLPMTFPPQEVNGFVVSGFDTPSTDSAFTYPATLRNELLQRFPHYDFIPSWGQDAHLSLEKFRSFTQAINDAFTLRTQAALYLIERFRPDVFMIQYQDLDVFQHKAWGYLTPPTPEKDGASPQRLLSLNCLNKLDENIGRLLGHEYYENANVLVVSDHGFGPTYGFIHANNFLEAWGYLKRKSSADTEQSSGYFDALRNRLRTSSLAPIRSLYQQLGRWRWRWRQRAKHKPTWLENVRTTAVEHDLPIIWEQSKAVVGMAEIYGLVQVFGDEDERTALCEELKRRFMELSDPQSGKPLFADVLEASSVYRGPHAAQVDLVLVPDDGWTVLRRFAEKEPIVREPTGLLGTHRPTGILIAAGPDFRADSPLTEANLCDVAPTIVHLLGGDVPEDMDGRVLTELLATTRLVVYRQKQEVGQIEERTMSAEEAQVLEKRLKALGYLG